MQLFLFLLLNLLLSGLIGGIRSPILVSTPQRRCIKLKSSSSYRVQPRHFDVLAQHWTDATSSLQTTLYTSQQRLHTLSSEALCKATTMTRSITTSPSFPHFIAGIAAGVLECLVGHPLDTIRVRIITAGNSVTGTGCSHDSLVHICLILRVCPLTNLSLSGILSQVLMFGYRSLMIICLIMHALSPSH